MISMTTEQRQEMERDVHLREEQRAAARRLLVKADALDLEEMLGLQEVAG